MNEVVDRIKKAGNSAAFGIIADVTTDSKRIIDETIKEFGQLDVLINNAGNCCCKTIWDYWLCSSAVIKTHVSHFCLFFVFLGIAFQDSIIDLKISEFDRIMAINLTAPVVLSNFAVPYLKKTKGNIVNVSSIGGLLTLPNFTSYCISKAALNQFTKSCALDLASKGIRVNAVNPATTRTPAVEKFGMSKQQADQFCDDIGKTYLVGRHGQPEDVSHAIAFLASDKASFLTGILLPVDGGSVTGIRPHDLNKYLNSEINLN